MARGGDRPFRTTSQEKAVSGPGKLSERTDMVPSGGAYGDRKRIEEQMAGAPMAKGTPTPSMQTQGKPAQKLTSLFEPSKYPDQPVTDGASSGPGYTPPPPVNPKYAMVAKYMDQLETMAADPSASDTFRTFVTYVRQEASKA
jgi:hypothetical protein